MFIERATHELAKNHRVRVVSSDGAEQIIFWATVHWVSARAHLSARCVPWKPRSANF